MRSKDVILIVGEDTAYVSSIENAMRKLGYACYTANSCAHGIQQVFEYYPDLIIYLPDEQCFKTFDLYNVVKESNLTFDIPFILISSNLSKDEVQLALELGVDGVYEKKLRMSDLQRIIDIRIKKHQRLRKESEKSFLKQFDNTSSPVVIYNSEYRIVSTNSTFDEVFTVNTDKNIWENLGFDKDEFLKISYRILASNDGRDAFKYVRQFEGEVSEYLVVVSSLNTFFAKKSAMLLFYSTNNPVSRFAENQMGILAQQRADNDGGILNTWSEELELRLGMNIHNAKPDNPYFPVIPEMNFTKRQLEVLELSIKGLPMKQIADKLCISEKTVEKYRASLMEKTGSRNIIELLLFAIRNKYVKV